MNEKQTALLEFELKMAQVPLANWTESNIRSWLTLRERANEDRRREMDCSGLEKLEEEWLKVN